VLSNVNPDYICYEYYSPNDLSELELSVPSEKKIVADDFTMDITKQAAIFACPNVRPNYMRH